eukprot:9708143-Alexandrium_andersonii.AAC.1
MPCRLAGPPLGACRRLNRSGRPQRSGGLRRAGRPGDRAPPASSEGKSGVRPRRPEERAPGEVDPTLGADLNRE